MLLSLFLATIYRFMLAKSTGKYFNNVIMKIFPKQFKRMLTCWLMSLLKCDYIR